MQVCKTLLCIVDCTGYRVEFEIGSEVEGRIGRLLETT
jgi:hypothetical protein